MKQVLPYEKTIVDRYDGVFATNIQKPHRWMSVSN